MPPENSVAHALKVLMNKVNRLAEASMPAECRQEATERQGRVLAYLYQNRDRDVYQRDVEAEFSISRATASQMLSAMEKNGLITRSGVAGDARLKRLALTEKAHVHIGRLWEGMRSFEAALTQGLSGEERETLLRLLKRIEWNADGALSALRNGKEIALDAENPCGPGKGVQESLHSGAAVHSTGGGDGDADSSGDGLHHRRRH